MTGTSRQTAGIVLMTFGVISLAAAFYLDFIGPFTGGSRWHDRKITTALFVTAFLLITGGAWLAA